MDNATARDVLAVDTQIDSIRRYLHYKHMPPLIRTILETEIQRLTETKLRIYVSSQFRVVFTLQTKSNYNSMYGSNASQNVVFTLQTKNTYDLLIVSCIR